MSNKFQPLVSVLIISYNQQEFIKEALVSALEQKYENLEVVVVDDASIDNTQHIITEVAKDYPENRLKIIFNRNNLGITGNCNVALQHCNGEFIAFMGGDDVLLPDKIVQQVVWFLPDASRVLCGHDVDWVDESGNFLDVSTSNLVPLVSGHGASRFIRNGTPYSATSIMVRKSRIPTYGFHPWLPVVSDWKLWIDVIRNDGVYGYVPSILAKYRRHTGNVTAKINWKITRDVLLTAGLSLWHFKGKYVTDWMHYFFVRPVIKRFNRKNG